MKKDLVLNRILSGIYDFIIVLALCLISAIPSIVTLINFIVNDSTFNAISLFISAFFGDGISIAIIILYCAVIPVIWNGQTLGYRLFGIKNQKNNGCKIDFKSMFLKTIFKVIIFLITFGLSLIIDLITLCSKEHVTFYDILASTKVVSAKD